MFHLHEGCGDLKNRNRFRPLVRSEPARDIEAMNVGEVDVEQYEVWLLADREAQSILASRRFDDLESVLTQRAPERVAQRRIVIDDEDERRIHATRAARSLRGSDDVFRNSAFTGGGSRVAGTDQTNVAELLSRHQSDILSEWRRPIADTRRSHLLDEGELRQQSSEFLAQLHGAVQKGASDDIAGREWTRRAGCSKISHDRARGSASARRRRPRSCSR